MADLLPRTVDNRRVPVEVIPLDENQGPVTTVEATNDGALRWAVEHPSDFPYVSQIDLYGDTVIEYAQLDDLISEWQQLREETTNRHEQAYVLEVEDILQQARERPGSAVRFLGD